MKETHSDAERALQAKYARLQALKQKSAEISRPPPGEDQPPKETLPLRYTLEVDAPPPPKRSKSDGKQAALEAIKAKRASLSKTPTGTGLSKKLQKPKSKMNTIKLKLGSADTTHDKTKQQALHDDDTSTAKPPSTVTVDPKRAAAIALAKQAQQKKKQLEEEKLKKASSLLQSSQDNATPSTATTTTTKITNKHIIRKRPPLKKPDTSPSNQQQQQQGVPPQSKLTSPTLFIGDLPEHFTADMLLDFFTYNFNSDVVDVKVVGGYHYGYITFSTFSEAEEVLLFHQQQPIAVDEYDPNSTVRIMWARSDVQGGVVPGGASTSPGKVDEHPRVKEARAAAVQVADQVMGRNGSGGGIQNDDGSDGEDGHVRGGRALVSYDDL